MERIFDLASQLLVSQAMLSHRLCAGRLLSPGELAQAAHKGDSGLMASRAWYLCGEVMPEMYANADFSQVQHLGRTFEGPSGCSYVVWAQQWGHWQHRFVLQLAGAEALQYLAFIQKEPIRFSLADGSGPKATLVWGPDALRTLVPPTLLVHPVPQDVVALSGEMLWVTAQMLAPQAVTDSQLPMVRHVCVSMVHTRSILDALKAQAQRDKGAELH